MGPIPARARPPAGLAGRGGAHDRGQVVMVGSTVALSSSRAWRPSGRSARWDRRRRCWLRAWKQRGAFPLGLQHPGLAGQLVPQPGVVGPQPRDLPLARVDRWAATTRALAQRLERATVTLLAPLTDQRRVQALAAQQRALAGLVQPLVLSQHAQLVGGRVLARWPRPSRYLRVGQELHSVSPRSDLHGGHRHVWSVPLSPSAQLFQLARVSDDHGFGLLFSLCGRRLWP